MKPENLIPRLITEFKYPEQAAALVADKLAACNPKILDSFSKWWQDGELDQTLNVEGYTLSRLIQDHSQKPIAAYLTLDWLIRDKDAALEVINRGHDSIHS